jgi:hypothetical protein
MRSWIARRMLRNARPTSDPALPMPWLAGPLTKTRRHSRLMG